MLKNLPLFRTRFWLLTALTLEPIAAVNLVAAELSADSVDNLTSSEASSPPWPHYPQRYDGYYDGSYYTYPRGHPLNYNNYYSYPYNGYYYNYYIYRQNYPQGSL